MSNESEIIPTAEVAVIKSENIASIVHTAPDSYRRNVQSTQNCVAACQALLDEINAVGMTDELDQKAAKYIERTRRTVKEMNERRSPYTKLFDMIRGEFTSLENSIDPSKADTIPNRLQRLRDGYAKKKREAEETRRRAEEARLAIEEARNSYRVACGEDCRRSFNRFITGAINRLSALYAGVTLDSYADVSAGIAGFPTELPAGWNPEISAPIPLNLTVDDAKEIATDELVSLMPRFAEQYKVEVGDYRAELLDKLPSKKVELERITRANAADAERIKADIARREAEEAARMENERRLKEESDKAKADIDRQNAEVQGLFARVAPAGYTPKAKVSQKLRVTSPSAFLSIVSLWWKNEGCNLSVEDLAKIFKKQIAYCEKLASKDGVFITDNPGLEYVEDVTAK